MKQIPAWQATDGNKFFDKSDCDKHEQEKKHEDFRVWFNSKGETVNKSPSSILHWLINNAEAIRGFLPPVEAKPELDIEVLRGCMEPISRGGLSVYVHIGNVKKWLAGELK
jgi:hypothetical protein